MPNEIEKNDIVLYLKELKSFCNGAILCANQGDCLHNFSLNMGQRLQDLINEIIRSEINPSLN